MKKIFLSLVAVMATMSINAQMVEIYQNGSLSATYTNSDEHTYKVVFEKDPARSFLPGTFSVSSTKQVKFTKSNIYWDGSDFKFEANQTDCQTSWDASHVSLFFWTNLTDYQSGTANYMPYAEMYYHGDRSTSDKCWCSEDNPLTVEGLSGLFPPTYAEWDYLLTTRTNAANLCKYAVTVTNNGTSYTNCFIIAPDNYDYITNPLKSSYTLDEVNTLGLVCLPAAGYRAGSPIYNYGEIGYYLSSTPYSDSETEARILQFDGSSAGTNRKSRPYGQSLRLVALQ